MFDGCFSNPGNYEEFFIDIQREDEICRDWRRVSCIKVKERRVPKFLQASYKEIFVCGKSVNLLKIFTSKVSLSGIKRIKFKCLSILPQFVHFRKLSRLYYR